MYIIYQRQNDKIFINSRSYGKGVGRFNVLQPNVHVFVDKKQLPDKNWPSKILETIFLILLYIIFAQKVQPERSFLLNTTYLYNTNFFC